MKFYAQRLGEKTSMTPEGFLVCHDVPLARVGEMLYRAGEVPVEAGSDGVIHVVRDEATLFHPDAISSYHGKPVVNDHPPEGTVTPHNYRAYACGTVQNPRRGTGDDADCLMGDLLITDAQAIADVRAGKREVSNGYDADYDTVAPGRGVQRNIYGNHVAIVTRGRCGTRCSIGDQYMTTAAHVDPAKPSFLDTLRKLVGTTDTAGATAVLAEAEAAERAAADAGKTKATADALTEMRGDIKVIGEVVLALAQGKTVDKDGKVIESKGKDEDDEKDEDEDGKTADAAAFTAAAPRFEILKPGFSIPTHDGAATRKAMSDRLHGCKCQALDAAYATEEGKRAIQPFIGAATGGFSSLPRHTVDAAFIGASELLKAANNGKTTDALTKRTTKDFGPTVDADTINKANAEFWANPAKQAAGAR